jgi:hypothetical protein
MVVFWIVVTSDVHTLLFPVGGMDGLRLRQTLIEDLLFSRLTNKRSGRTYKQVTQVTNSQLNEEHIF